MKYILLSIATWCCITLSFAEEQSLPDVNKRILEPLTTVNQTVKNDKELAIPIGPGSIRVSFPSAHFLRNPSAPDVESWQSNEGANQYVLHVYRIKGAVDVEALKSKFDVRKDWENRLAEVNQIGWTAVETIPGFETSQVSGLKDDTVSAYVLSGGGRQFKLVQRVAYLPGKNEGAAVVLLCSTQVQDQYASDPSCEAFLQSIKIGGATDEGKPGEPGPEIPGSQACGITDYLMGNCLIKNTDQPCTRSDYWAGECDIRVTLPPTEPTPPPRPEEPTPNPIPDKPEPTPSPTPPPKEQPPKEREKCNSWWQWVFGQCELPDGKECTEIDYQAKVCVYKQ